MYKKYHALSESDGIAGIGELLKDGDVYINKHVPQY